MSNFEMNHKNFETIVIDLLIDILATNRDIIDRIDSIYPIDSSDEEMIDNRVLVLEYLQSKHGELPKTISDFLKTKGIDKSDK